jgi:beta-phosphoglucomutase
MRKTVLFDMDGVILDSMPCHVKAWQEAMAEEGFEVQEELIYLHEGAIEPETAVSIFSGNGCRMTESGFSRVLSRQIEIFRKRYFSSVRPYPGVADILDDLKEDGWNMALVTSSHSSVVEDVLPASIRNSMSCIISGDMVEKRKPDPGPYIEAMKRMQVMPSDCTVVENAPAGIRAARAASAKCVAIKTTLSAEHLSEADYIADDHEQMCRLVKESCK